MNHEMTAPNKASSMIALVGTEDNHLLVRFNKGKLYRYHNAASHFEALISADSAGQYLNNTIKPNFTAELIDG